MKLHADIPYVSYGNVTLLLDLHLPREATEPVPVVMHVIGGGWQNCEKSAAADSWAFLVDHGFAVASIQYRVSSNAKAPANIHDCKAAVRWLRANAAKYNLDPARIGAIGSSAGGHLVGLLGASHGVKELEGPAGNRDQSSDVKTVCAYCGVFDLVHYRDQALCQQNTVLADVITAYLGGPVETRLDLARLVSPITYVSPHCPPMFLLHGDADVVVPMDESVRFHDRLQKAGADVTFRRVPGGGAQLGLVGDARRSHRVFQTYIVREAQLRCGAKRGDAQT